MNIISVPALKITQPIGEFYVCAFSAQDLIKISWVDVRKISSEAGEIDDYLGIQRKISEPRVKQIRRYVQTADATFPTSIIVAIPGRCARWDDAKRELSIFEYTNVDDPSQNVNFDRIAKILDGQHRLRGLAQPDGDQFSFDLPENVPFELNVVVFIEADIAQQATIFSTVNLAQTKVNKSLVYDLFSLAKSRSPQKSAHAIAVALDKEPGSPFFKSLKRLGVATPGRGEFDEYLTQSTFVEALLQLLTPSAVDDRDFFLRSLAGRLKYPNSVELERYVLRGLFIDEKEGEIARIIWAYFDAIRIVWPASWSTNERGNIIRRTNGFKAFMAVFSEIYKLALSGNKIGSFVPASDYVPIFCLVNIKDGGFTAEAFPPGSSGESALKKELRSAINKYLSSKEQS